MLAIYIKQCDCLKVTFGKVRQSLSGLPKLASLWVLRCLHKIIEGVDALVEGRSINHHKMLIRRETPAMESTTMMFQNMQLYESCYLEECPAQRDPWLGLRSPSLLLKSVSLLESFWAEDYIWQFNI